MARVLCVLILTICSSVSNAAASTRIVGGIPTALGQFPWMVSLRGAASSSHFCGGNFVTRQHVLTAAHCVINNEPSSIFVVSKSISNIQGGENHAVSHIRNHEAYIGRDDYWQNDISVLRLTAPVELDATRTILPLPTRDTVHGENCFISGWGRIHFPSSGLPAFQQHMSLNSIGIPECQAIWGVDVINSTHLCGLASRGIGVCNGDSGSPLVCNGEHAGIASWVNPCANGMPDVYARVYAFLDWIADKIQDVDQLH